MRCSCCNKNLSDYESTLKSLTTGDYTDTCVKCLKDLDIVVIGNSQNTTEVPNDPYDPDFWEQEEILEEEEDETD